MSPESDPGDTDYIPMDTQLTISWNNVFRDSYADIAKYRVAIGMYLVEQYVQGQPGRY